MPHLSSAQFLIKPGPHPTGRIRHTALMDVFNLKKCKYSFKLFTQQPFGGKKETEPAESIVKKGGKTSFSNGPCNMQLKYTCSKKK